MRFPETRHRKQAATGTMLCTGNLSQTPNTTTTITLNKTCMTSAYIQSSPILHNPEYLHAKHQVHQQQHQQIRHALDHGARSLSESAGIETEAGHRQAPTPAWLTRSHGRLETGAAAVAGRDGAGAHYLIRTRTHWAKHK